MSNIYSTNTLYSTQEIQQIYVFDIKIIDNNNNIIKKKILTIDKLGELLEYNNNIRKLKIIFSIIDSDNIDSVILKKTFNEDINETIAIFKKKIIIYISSKLDNVLINFQIN